MAVGTSGVSGQARRALDGTATTADWVWLAQHPAEVEQIMNTLTSERARLEEAAARVGKANEIDSLLEKARSDRATAQADLADARSKAEALLAQARNGAEDMLASAKKKAGDLMEAATEEHRAAEEALAQADQKLADAQAKEDSLTEREKAATTKMENAERILAKTKRRIAAVQHALTHGEQLP